MKFFQIALAIVPMLCSEAISAKNLSSNHNTTEFRTFPQSFLFATGTASYQIEGAWAEDGKGENIWDRLTHTKPEIIANRANGDIACDSYHKYKEDVSLLKDLGFDVYRFSISWARVLPTGDITKVNEKGIQYYIKLIDELLEKGIQPMVTMYHFDLPQKLQDIGGWMNPLIADYFEDYADLLYERLGNKVKFWITINEPWTVVIGYENIQFAPNLPLDSPANYIVAHNVLRAHARAFKLYETKYRSLQKGKITIALNGPSMLPKTNSKEDHEAADRAMQFLYGWFAHPLCSKEGDYPKIMRQVIDDNSQKEGRKRSRLPVFTEDEIKLIRGSIDFLSVNYYYPYLCSPQTTPLNTSTYEKDLSVKKESDPKWPVGVSRWLTVYPEGFRQLLLWIKKECNNIPVFVTENGNGDAGQLDDVDRESYHRTHLEVLLKAMKVDGCNVIGYTAWAFIDNFEWLFGYTLRFGLVHVDFNDPKRKRTPKRSAAFFKNFLKTRIIPESDEKNNKRN